MIKENKIHKYMIDDVEISSDFNEKNSEEETLLEKLRWRKMLIMKEILMRKLWKKLRRKKF